MIKYYKKKKRRQVVVLEENVNINWKKFIHVARGLMSSNRCWRLPGRRFGKRTWHICQMDLSTMACLFLGGLSSMSRRVVSLSVLAYQVPMSYAVALIWGAYFSFMYQAIAWASVALAVWSTQRSVSTWTRQRGENYLGAVKTRRAVCMTSVSLD